VCVQRASHFSAPKLARCATGQPRLAVSCECAESLAFQRAQARPLRDRTASFSSQLCVCREPRISARPSSPAARQDSLIQLSAVRVQRGTHFSAPELNRCATETSSFSSLRHQQGAIANLSPFVFWVAAFLSFFLSHHLVEGYAPTTATFLSRHRLRDDIMSTASMTGTFHRRELSSPSVSFSSEEGQALFRAALTIGNMAGYFYLAEAFITQGEPAFCGIGSLTMVLNSLLIDPRRVWKGVWRWFDESMLDCCEPLDIVMLKGKSV
jgi:hypothetical protein